MRQIVIAITTQKQERTIQRTKQILSITHGVSHAFSLSKLLVIIGLMWYNQYKYMLCGDACGIIAS